jgi:hypothetical protein
LVLLAAWSLLLLVFMIGLGYRTGNLAFGLMLSIHVTSLGVLFQPYFATSRLRVRFLFGICSLVFLALMLYMPARNFIQEHFFMPLRLNGEVIVVGKLDAGTAVRRGDWIAYNMESQELAQQVYSRSGYGLGPVLAVGGDRVSFTPNACEINGIAQPRRGHMPTSGTLVVPEKHWFVWPDVDMTGHGNVPEERISDSMQRMALISTDQFRGRALKRWFWRRQHVS